MKRLLQFFPNIQVIAACYDPSVLPCLKQAEKRWLSFKSDRYYVSFHIHTKHNRAKAKSIGQKRNNFLKNRFHTISPAERNTVVEMALEYILEKGKAELEYPAKFLQALSQNAKLVVDAVDNALELDWFSEDCKDLLTHKAEMHK